jgi:hypothetical protein
MTTDAQTRLKMTLGDMIVQLSMAHARIEELEEELAKLKQQKPDEAKPPSKPNGRPSVKADAQ